MDTVTQTVKEFMYRCEALLTYASFGNGLSRQDRAIILHYVRQLESACGPDTAHEEGRCPSPANATSASPPVGKNEPSAG